MKSVLIPIPVMVLTRLKEEIEPFGYSAADTAQLYAKCIELWFTLYAKHEQYKHIEADNYYAFSAERLYVNVQARDLQPFNVQIAGHRYQYRNLLSILVNAQVLEINEKYSVSRFSKSFRPHPDLLFDKLSIVELDLKAFTKSCAYRSTREEKLKEYPELATLINAVYDTTIDLEQAVALINEAGLEAHIGYDHCIRAIKIYCGLHFFAEADYTGRLYTSIAGCPSEIVPALRLYGQPLIEIDVANCQPLLLANLLGHEQMQAVCESGRFYETLMEFTGETDRKEIKVKLYKHIMFNAGWVTPYVGGSIAIAFERLFPGSITAINAHKPGSESRLAEWIDTGRTQDLLWCRMQSLEADIVITAAEAFPHALTRHDSILIPANEDPTPVIDALMTEFTIRGMTPVLKIKNHKS